MTRNTDVTIRSLERRDWSAWWAVRLRCLTDHPDAFGQDYNEAISAGEVASRERYEATSITGRNRIFGAFDDELNLVGVIGIIGNDRAKTRHRMDIWGMYVEPSARGTGTGRRLVDAAISHAHQVDGVLQVHLTVTSHNHAAIALYTRCGFQRYGREPRARMLPDGPVDEDLMITMFDTPWAE